MTILLVGPDTSGWTLTDPSASGIMPNGGDACWFANAAIPYTAVATGNITEAYLNVFTWNIASTAHMYLFDGGGNLIGGTYTNAGTGFSSAGGTGSNLVATGFTPMAVTISSTYIMVVQANSGSGWRPNGRSGGGTHTISNKHTAGFPYGNPPSTLPGQDASQGGVLELAMWFQGDISSALLMGQICT